MAISEQRCRFWNKPHVRLDTLPTSSTMPTLWRSITVNKQRLAEVSFLIGSSLVEQDAASAMDDFQRALFAGLEPDKVGRIGEFFQAWVAESLAQRSMHPSLESLILWGAFCRGIGQRNT